MRNEEIYDKKSDEEVVMLFQSGKIESDSYLIRRFYPLVLRSSRHFFIAGAEQEDLYQEGTVGLFEAMKGYDPKKNVRFQTFASACILNHQMKAVEAANRKKHTPLNTYVSLYATDDSQKELIDTLESKQFDDPEKLFLEMETYRDLMEKITDILSSFENRVLERYLMGEDYKTISEALHKDEKSIDNAIQRIRSKIKKQFV